MESLAEATYRKFGAAHVLCNNAGVGGDGAPAWVTSLDNWRWVLGVNLFGAIHAIGSFMPRMLAGGQEGHVVNTASIAGLISGPMIAPYHASKHAVVALSESLSLDLQLAKSKIGVSVLCPGFVKTRIADSNRNRPASVEPSPFHSAEFRQLLRGMVEQGSPPSDVAEQVFDAIAHNRFWVLTHPALDPLIRARADAMLERRNPQLLAEFPPSGPAKSSSQPA